MEYIDLCIYRVSAPLMIIPAGSTTEFFRNICMCCLSFFYLDYVQVADHRVKLQELENLIANLGTGEEVVTDQAFEDRLKEAEREVTDLLREAQDVKGICMLNSR